MVANQPGSRSMVIKQLTNRVLDSAGHQRLACLRQLHAAVDHASPGELTPLEAALPALAPLLYDLDYGKDGNEHIMLDLFRCCRINKPTIYRLIELQRLQSNPQVITAFGMSNPQNWDEDAYLMLAEALALEDTASAAAEVLFKHSLAVNVSLTIGCLENLALHHQAHVRSEAISKLISHTEGSHSALACQSLRNILSTVDETSRVEVAAKLAWSRRNGLSLLKITAADNNARVRRASAKAIWHGYRIRGRELLTALSNDDDPQVRQVAIQGLA